MIEYYRIARRISKEDHREGEKKHEKSVQSNLIASLSIFCDWARNFKNYVSPHTSTMLNCKDSLFSFDMDVPPQAKDFIKKMLDENITNWTDTEVSIARNTDVSLSENRARSSMKSSITHAAASLFDLDQQHFDSSEDESLISPSMREHVELRGYLPLKLQYEVCLCFQMES